MNTKLTMQDIKKATREGKRVHWMNEGYTVIYDGSQYLIGHISGHFTGLTEEYRPGDFYIKP